MTSPSLADSLISVKATFSFPLWIANLVASDWVVVTLDSLDSVLSISESVLVTIGVSLSGLEEEEDELPSPHPTKINNELKDNINRLCFFILHIPPHF